MRKDFFKALLLGLSLLLFDILIKYWVYHYLSINDYTSFLYPYGGIGVFQNILGIDFCITRVTNLGGAWGIFSSYPIVLLIIRIGILFGVVTYTVFLNDIKKRRLPFLLIITGALGNILDCFIYGFVIDMFHFTFWRYSFPVFNIADSLIFLGVASLVIQAVFQKKKKYVSKFSNQSP